MIVRAWISLALAPLLFGCQLLGGLQVDAVKAEAKKPSNVSVYLSVRKEDVALADLQAEHFALTENDQPLDSSQVGLRLLDRQLVAEHRVLLLLDLSGPINDSGAIALLTTQVLPLVERLRIEHDVSVYGFDGSESLTQIGSFERLGPGSKPPVTKQDFARLTAFKQKDPSSNLNGAVTQGLQTLDRELSASSKPITIGSMLIVARGPDLAGRTPEALMVDTIDDSPHQVYAVTVNATDDTHLAELIGPAGYSQVKYFENLEVGLADVARSIETDYGRYYFLSYCSPARAGERNLMITVSTHDGDGAEVKGDASVAFDASGFGSGCDPSRPAFHAKNKGASKVTAATPTPSSAAPEGDVVPPPSGGTYAE